MPLSVRGQPYKIPEYSLTGDLLAYLTCPLQYRYHNKASLPPSTPVQLWFGEFIHSVMEEAYLEWQQDQQRRRFPWNWDPDIRNIELEIERRLEARNLYAPPNLFCAYGLTPNRRCVCSNRNPPHPHQLIASQRAEAAINTWGQHLFPLIDEAEVRLKGIRPMPNYQPGISRCNYYGITGVVDVISSVNLQNAPPGNLILHYLHQNTELQRTIANLTEYEIIIDYKGMRRLSTNDPTWQHHEWQILTYAWLRSQQPQSKPIVAGILFYFNELALSQEEMKELKKDVDNKTTDVLPQGKDLQAIQNWRRNITPPVLSTPFREQRSIRIIPVNDSYIQNSLQQFDRVVGNIESCVLSEMSGRDILHSWRPNPNERNCTACDFKTFCPNPAPRRYHPTVP